MSTKLRCLLLDDELPGLTYLKMLCDEMQELEVVRAYDNPERLLKDLPQLEFDLCIIDIEMPSMNGLQLASLLTGKLIIFTTAYKEYAAEAFDVDAIDYVRKPVQRDRLHHAVQKAMDRHKAKAAERAFVQLNTDKGKTLLYVDQLLYCTVSDSDSRDKIAFMADGTQVTIKNMAFERLIELLPDGQFFRINKKDVIALRAVHSFSYNEVTSTISVGAGQFLKLPVTESYRKNFLQHVRQS